MAKKKASKTASKAVTATPAMMVASAKTATAADTKQDAILGCIVKVFTDVGLPHISSPDVKIVWAALNDPDDVIDQLGDGIRDCIIGKSFQCEGLAGLFQILHDGNKITTVTELVAMIASVVTP